MVKRFLLPLLIFFFATISVAINYRLATSGSIDIRGVEPNVIYTIESSILGNPLYQDVTSPPYAVTQYSPLFYLVSVEIARALGLTPGIQYADILTLGRLISFSSLLALSVVCFLIARRVGSRNVVASLSAILVLNLTTPWFSLARPDALSALFGISGLALLVFSLTETKEGRNTQLFSAIAGAGCWFALLTKQTGIVFIIIGAALALLIDRRRLATGYFAGLLLSLVATALTAHLLFSVSLEDLTNFYRNAIDGIQNGINLELAYTKTYDLALTRYSMFLAFPLACLLFTVTNRGDCPAHVKGLAIAFGLSLAFGLASTLKQGSAINYLNEPMILGVLLTTATLASNPARLDVSGTKFLGTIALLFSGLFLTANTLTQLRQYQVALHAPRHVITDPLLTDKLGAELTQNKNSHFLVESGSRIATLLFPERVVSPHPDITTTFKYTPAALSGQARMIESGEIRYIIRTIDESRLQTVSAFKVLYKGVDQELLINTCKPTASKPSSSEKLSEKEFRNLSIEFVEKIQTGNQWFVRLKIVNSNSSPISAFSDSGNTIRLSWRFHGKDSRNADNWNMRTDLPCNIEANGVLEAVIPIKENLDNSKTLQFNLVQEGIFWLHDIGTPPLSIPWNSTGTSS